MPSHKPVDDEFPAQTFDTFYSLRTPDDEPEVAVVIDRFPPSIPEPTSAVKSAHKKES